MLIQLKVANFRSFKSEQTFSMVAQTSEAHLEHHIIPIPSQKFSLLKGCGIYGANASGKTTLLNVIAFLVNFVRDSFRSLDGERIDSAPFALDEQQAEQPSRFEVSFIEGNVCFTYGLEVTPTRVISEYLARGVATETEMVFERDWNSGKNAYDWQFPHKGFQPDENMLGAASRANCAMLSVVGQYRSVVALPAYEWFKERNKLATMRRGLFHPGFSIHQLHEGEHREQILNLLKVADLGILDAKTTLKELTEQDVAKLPKAVANSLRDETGAIRKTLEASLVHAGSDGVRVPLDLENESEGTIALLTLAGPLFDVLKNGYILVLDEIETSLHPLIVRELLRIFHSNEYNRHGAQIIFTTHSLFLLDADVLRRDQLWMVNKGLDGATRLEPLTLFKDHPDEPRQLGYVFGRYTGIPRIKPGLLK